MLATTDAIFGVSRDVGAPVPASSQRRVAPALEVTSAIAATLEGIPGISAVRLIARNRTGGRSHHKAFIVLRTHDIERDAQIVERMSQFDQVDYDLVPEEAEGMIPSDTIEIQIGAAHC